MLKPTKAIEGQNVQFRAVVRGNPMPDVRWFYLDDEISDSEDFTFEYNRDTGECILTIANVLEEDTGKYTILAENSIGRTMCSTDLRVLSLPTEESEPIQTERREIKQPEIMTIQDQLDVSEKSTTLFHSSIDQKCDQDVEEVFEELSKKSEPKKPTEEIVTSDRNLPSETNQATFRTLQQEGATEVTETKPAQLLDKDEIVTVANNAEITDQTETADTIAVSFNVKEQAFTSEMKDDTGITSDNNLEDISESVLLQGEVNVTVEAGDGQISKADELEVKPTTELDEPISSDEAVTANLKDNETENFNQSDETEVFSLVQEGNVRHPIESTEVPIIMDQEVATDTSAADVEQEPVRVDERKTIITQEFADEINNEELNVSETITFDIMEVTDDASTIMSDQTDSTVIEQDLGEPPEFIEPLSPLIVPVGDTCAFLAKLTGSPTPSVTWYRNNEPVSINEKITTFFNDETKEAILTVEDCCENDSADFCCVGENKYGRAQSRANLVVIRKYRSRF